ncbi:MAG: LysR substrate-binding domain-containing protein [Reyranella sp.]|uniref:LysR family transcriptional regulator n=1 Tax=Reyranella sp. TaxID=1929291 RepID=UPI003D0FCF45
MVSPSDLLLFAQAVESGGFAPAARRLNLPKSTLSKRLAALEAALGARLVQRTSRSFVLTELGREIYQHARAVQIEVESAEMAVQRRLAEPSGTVRMTASIPTMQFEFVRRLPRFAELHPKIRLVLHASDRFVDLVQEGFDVAVRSHFSPLPDSGLVQRRLRVQPIVLVAAPSYLAARGAPRCPDDLASHDGLLANEIATTWRLRNESGDEAVVAPRLRMAADESTMLLGAALAGLGIAPVPEHICRDQLESGALARVLPAWRAGDVTTTILTPHRRGQLPAVRAVIGFLIAHDS